MFGKEKNMNTKVNIQHQPSYYMDTNHNTNSNSSNNTNIKTNLQKIDNFDNYNDEYIDDETDLVELSNKKIYISGQKMDISFPKVYILVINYFKKTHVWQYTPIFF